MVRSAPDHRGARLTRGLTALLCFTLVAVPLAGALVAPASPWIEREKLTAEILDLPPRDNVFAYAFTVDGDTLAAPHGWNVVHLFTRQAGTWMHSQTLLPPPEPLHEREGRWGEPNGRCFGYAIDVDDQAGVMVIGDPCLDIPGNITHHETDAGAMHIYERSPDGIWEHVQRFIGPVDGDWNDDGTTRYSNSGPNMGLSVSVDNGAIVVGTLNDVIDGVPRAGSAAVYERTDDGTWEQTARFTTPTGKPEVWDSFGVGVSLRGDRIAIGSPSEDGALGSGSGAVHIYERGDEGWVHAQRIGPPLLQAGGTALSPPTEVMGEVAIGESFGALVELDDDGTSLIGSAFWSGRTAGIGIPMGPDFDMLGIDQLLTQPTGAAYVFDLTEEGWELTGILENPDRERASWFGRVSLSEDGDFAVVGAVLGNKSDVEGLNIARGFLSSFVRPLVDGTGVAYVFERSEDGWRCTARITGHDSGPGDFFGHSPRIAGDEIYIGAPYNGGRNAGAVYTFARSDAPGGDPPTGHTPSCTRVV